VVEERKTITFETFERFQTSHSESTSVGLADRVEEALGERVSAPLPKLAADLSIASSPKNQVKTVGLLSPKSQVKTVGPLVSR
jgi:hypothetical protein